MTLQLYDLGTLVAIVLGSMSSVMALFQLARDLFLDRLTQAMDSGQRDTLYRTLVYLTLVVIITVLALMNGYTLSVMLVVSAGVAAYPIMRTVHLVYTGLQKPANQEIPVGVYDTPATPDVTDATNAANS